MDLFYSKNTINNENYSDIENFNQLNTTDKINKVASKDSLNNTSTIGSEKTEVSTKASSKKSSPASEGSSKGSPKVSTEASKSSSNVSSNASPKKPVKIVKKITPVITQKKVLVQQKNNPKIIPTKIQKKIVKKISPSVKSTTENAPKKVIPKKQLTKKPVKKITPATITNTNSNKPGVKKTPNNTQKKQLVTRSGKKIITRERAEEIIQSKLYELIKDENLNITETQLLMKMIERAKNKQFFTKLYSDEIYNKYVIKKNPSQPVSNKLSQKLVEKFSNENIPVELKNDLQNTLRLGMNSSDLVLKKTNNNKNPKEDSEISSMSKSLSPSTIKETVTNFVKSAVSKAVNSMNLKDVNKNKMEISGQTIKPDPRELEGSEIPSPRISYEQSKRLRSEKVPELANNKSNNKSKNNKRSPNDKRSPRDKKSPSDEDNNLKSSKKNKKNSNRRVSIKDDRKSGSGGRSGGGAGRQRQGQGSGSGLGGTGRKGSGAAVGAGAGVGAGSRKRDSKEEENIRLRNMLRKMERARSGNLRKSLSEINSEKQLRSEKQENEKLRRKVEKLERRLGSVKVYNPTAAETDSSDLPYNDYVTQGLLPLGAGLQSWKNDYVLLNTDKWRPAINPIPHCKVEKECPVCPNVGYGFAKQYTTLKEFNKSRKVMPPDTINIDYINKLNEGR